MTPDVAVVHGPHPPVRGQPLGDVPTCCLSENAVDGRRGDQPKWKPPGEAARSVHARSAHGWRLQKLKALAGHYIGPCHPMPGAEQWSTDELIRFLVEDGVLTVGDFKPRATQ
jgi:hypothetical protein